MWASLSTLISYPNSDSDRIALCCWIMSSMHTLAEWHALPLMLLRVCVGFFFLFVCFSISFGALQAFSPFSVNINCSSYLRFILLIINAVCISYLCLLLPFYQYKSWYIFLLVCVCVCPDLYMNFNLGALVFQECCHTRQKWNLWVCGFCVSVLCMCVCMCVCVCVFLDLCL